MPSTKKTTKAKPATKRKRTPALGANGLAALLKGPCCGGTTAEQQAKWDAEQRRQEVTRLAADFCVAVLRSGQGVDYRAAVRAARELLSEVDNPTVAVRVVQAKEGQ